MSLTIRRTAVAIATVAIAGSAVLAGSGAAHAATAPPWEPDAGSAGGLLFYDAAGHVITGGSITDRPLAAYVEGTVAPHAGDTKATLFGFTPVLGQQPSAWSGEAIGGSTTYPATTAPAPLKTSKLPVETGAITDESVGDYASDFPNSDDSTTDGYAGIYQLRLYTSGTAGAAAKYDSADIQVTGSTWTVVYSKTQVTSSLKLTVTPTSAYHGATVKLSAAVTPSTAAGTVKFYDGTKVLKTVTVSGGKAALSIATLSDATHKLKAVFTPTSSALYTASTSAVHSLVVKAHTTKTTVTASKSSIAKGKKLTLTIKESPAAAGTFTIYNGSTKLGTATVKKGKATFSTTKLAVGSHSLKAKFTPTSTANYAASTSKVVKVKVTK